MKYEFYQVDVFSSNPFGGNPLATILEAKGLTNDTMQKIAQEMNLSETVFISDSTGLSEDFSIRIFSPQKELPFAGHPLLGTAHILRETGKIPSGKHILKLGTKAGTISIAQEENENLIFMAQPLPEFRPPLDFSEEISETLGIPYSSIDSTRYPIQIVSTGLPVLIVPIISLDAIEKITVDFHQLKTKLDQLGTDLLYAFTRQTIHPHTSIHSRAFAPALGISEDPATGSAAGALGAYLVNCDLKEGTLNKKFCIEQGYEIGRQAFLYVEVEQKAGQIKSVRVGGESVTVIKGWMDI